MIDLSSGNQEWRWTIFPQSPPDVGELFDEQKKGFYTLQASMLYIFFHPISCQQTPNKDGQ